MIKWVTNEKAAEALGSTRQANYSRIKRRQWREGIHWIKRGGRVWINLEAIYQWIEQPT